MDKIISQIKKRIFQYIDNQKIVKESFFKKTLISASNFKGTGAKSELGGEMIAKILTNYPDLNADWVITGRGEMINAAPGLAPVKEQDEIILLQMELKDLKEKYNALNEKYTTTQEKYSDCLERERLKGQIINLTGAGTKKEKSSKII